MRVPTIRVVDFSGGTDFRDALSSTTSLIRTIAERGHYTDDDVWAPAEPMAHVDFVSSDDTAILVAALAADALVLHVASHTYGRGSEGPPAFFGREDERAVSDVAEWLQRTGQGVMAACLFVDGCNGGTARFMNAVRHCLAANVVYVGSRRMVTEADAAIFAANFYGAVLQKKGKGLDRQERVETALLRAASAFAEATGKQCPYQSRRLLPHGVPSV